LKIWNVSDVPVLRFQSFDVFFEGINGLISGFMFETVDEERRRSGRENRKVVTSEMNSPDEPFGLIVISPTCHLFNDSLVRFTSSSFTGLEFG